MYRLIYISTASDALTSADVDAIVDASIRNNAPRNITGVLIYNGLNFLQVLEGTRLNVEEVFNRIVQDPRHISVTTVLAECENREQLEQMLRDRVARLETMLYG